MYFMPGMKGAPAGAFWGMIGVAVSSALLHWQIQTKALIGMENVDKIYPDGTLVTPGETWY
jgi:hypothetical protein